MLRDTLEMIPIAVIMTVIFSFGIRSERVPALEPYTRGARSTSAADRDTAASDNNTVQSMTETRAIATAVPDPPLEASAPDSRTQLFVERSSWQRPGVPFFCTADVVAMREQEPERSRAAAPLVGATNATSSGGAKIVINTADQAMLQKLPGIGPTRAQAILGQRPATGFRTWDELDAVPGIGPGTLAMIRLHAVLNSGDRP